MNATNQMKENPDFPDKLFYIRQISSQAIFPINETSFHKVMNDYSFILLSTAFHLTKNRQAAEDIVQETFLELWKKRTEILPDNIGGWLYRVTRNLAYKHMRTESYNIKLNAFLSIAGENFYTDVEERLIHKESLKAFTKVYSSLPRKQREVYRLSKVEGYSRNEIANHLNISIYTVKNHLAKAVQFIKEHFTSACLCILFLAFNNLFFNRNSPNSRLRELYKVNQAVNKWLPEKPGSYFPNSRSFSGIKIHQK